MVFSPDGSAAVGAWTAVRETGPMWAVMWGQCRLDGRDARPPNRSGRSVGGHGGLSSGPVGDRITTLRRKFLLNVFLVEWFESSADCRVVLRSSLMCKMA